MPPQNHSHLSTRPEVRRPSRPQIRTAVLECREAWSSQSPDTVLAFDKRPHERPQPSKAPRPPNMQGRFFAVCFRSLSVTLTTARAEHSVLMKGYRPLRRAPENDILALDISEVAQGIAKDWF